MFDIVDARVTNDSNKTFLLGVDIMSGSEDKVMLPWKVDLAGKIEINLRRQDLPWMIFSDLRVLEEYTYNTCWDDKPWNPRNKAKAKLPPPPPKGSANQVKPEEKPWKRAEPGKEKALERKGDLKKDYPR